jgi:hypothetical protein
MALYSDSSAILNFAVYSILGAFAKLRKAHTIFIMSVRPSVRMEKLGFPWTNFHAICYLNISRKICREN